MAVLNYSVSICYQGTVQQFHMLCFKVQNVSNWIIIWTKFSTVSSSGPNQCLLFVLTTYLSFSDKLCCRRLSSYNEQKPGKKCRKTEEIRSGLTLKRVFIGEQGYNVPAWYILGNKSKDDVDDSECVISKCNFACLQSFRNWRGVWNKALSDFWCNVKFP